MNCKKESYESFYYQKTSTQKLSMVNFYKFELNFESEEIY